MGLVWFGFFFQFEKNIFKYSNQFFYGSVFLIIFLFNQFFFSAHPSLHTTTKVEQKKSRKKNP
jgi:hypothetical protein